MPRAPFALRHNLICPSCHRHCRGTAEVSYFVGLVDVGPISVCPPCFEWLETEYDGVELTGRIHGDPAAFGRKRR